MQCNQTEGNKAGALSAGETDKVPSHAPQFTKVLDGRRHPIRGLWRTKTGRYYAQLQFKNAATGEKKVHRVPLLDKDKRPVGTVPEAVKALSRLKVKAEGGDVPLLGRSPRFGDYAKRYLEFVKAGEGTKKPGTVKREEGDLREWEKDIGDLPLDRIQPYHVNQFRKRRLEAGARHQTVNGNLVTLRNVLRLAKTEGYLKVLPTVDIQRLKVETPRRPLFTAADIDKLCAGAFKTETNEAGEQVPATENAPEFADYVRLLAYSGAREQEALRLRWVDVDFERGQLTIGAAGDTKNSTARTVDFNPKLRAHLEDMATRLAPDSPWLFPSPLRGDRGDRVKTFRASLILARRAAGMEHPRTEPAEGARRTIKRERLGMAFHDLRHTFISMAVMSGIDFMTIASWVGHRDGGVLIGKVYGHLADAHKKEQAQRLNFGPAAVEPEVAGGGL